MDRNLIKTETFIRQWTLTALIVALILPILKPEWVEINQLGIGGKSLQYLVTHFLFPFFFFHVGLEARKEIISKKGALYGKKFILPFIAAIGGVLGPILISGAILGSYSLKSGILIPIATDIAFVLFAMSIAGVSKKTTTLVLALAVVDDLIGVGFIALIEPFSLSAGLVYIFVFFVLAFCWYYEEYIDRVFKSPLWWFGFVIFFIWLFDMVHIHTTLAGIVVAFMVPFHPGEERIEFNQHHHSTSIYHVLEYDILKDLVGIVIIPTFIITSLAIDWGSLSFSALLTREAFAVSAGLLFGKSIFIFVTGAIVALLLKEEIDRVEWFFCSILCGIGLTVSMFFIPLSNVQSTAATIAVLATSFACAVIGVLGLKFSRGYFHYKKIPAFVRVFFFF